MGERLRAQQAEVRMVDTEEANLYAIGDLVWLKSYYKRKGNCAKLLPKYVGLYRITEVLPHHTYGMERNGKSSIQHEGRIRLHVKSEDIEAGIMENQEQTRIQEEDNDDNIIPRDTLLQQQREIWNPINSATTTRNKKKSTKSLIKTQRTAEDTDSYISDEQERSNEPNKHIQEPDNENGCCTINHDSETAKSNSGTLEYTHPTLEKDIIQQTKMVTILKKRHWNIRTYSSDK